MGIVELEIAGVEGDRIWVLGIVIGFRELLIMPFGVRIRASRQREAVTRRKHRALQRGPLQVAMGYTGLGIVSSRVARCLWASMGGGGCAVSCGSGVVPRRPGRPVAAGVVDRPARLR